MNTDNMHVLVAVDDSLPATWAADVGVALARRTGGRVTLLHVVAPPSTGVSEGVLILVDELADQLKAAGAALLDAAARRLPGDVPVTAVLREGPPAQEIVAAARAAGTDLIVIGSRGRGRWAHFVLGSTAEAVIRDAPCPVVTVSHDPSVAATTAADTGAAARREPVTAAMAAGAGAP